MWLCSLGPVTVITSGIVGVSVDRSIVLKSTVNASSSSQCKTVIGCEANLLLQVVIFLLQISHIRLKHLMQTRQSGLLRTLRIDEALVLLLQITWM